MNFLCVNRVMQNGIEFMRFITFVTSTWTVKKLSYVKLIRKIQTFKTTTSRNLYKKIQI